MRRLWTSFVLLCSLLVLPACSAPSPAGEYKEAISAVEGVESVSVEWERAGAGDLTFIAITTATNDPAELHQILDQAVRAFIESADPHEETTLSFMVHSQDRSTSLTPGALGPGMGTLSGIREHYGLG